MEPLDEALGKLLSDPGAMAQVMSLAQSIGAALPQAAEEDPPQPEETPDRQTALLRALGSFLPPKRREKLERAMQVAQLSRLARTALAQSDREE